MKSKQGELEQALTYMITQNLKLLNENKRLWRELIKKKYDFEYLSMFFYIFL